MRYSIFVSPFGKIIIYSPYTDIPGPPASMKFDEVLSEQIKLSWEAPLADGGSPITNYVVDKRETSRANWAQVSAKISGDTKECLVEKLIEGHEYQFRVRAENRYGTGDAIISDPVVARNPFSKTLLLVYVFYFLDVLLLDCNVLLIYSCSWSM